MAPPRISQGSHQHPVVCGQWAGKPYSGCKQGDKWGGGGSGRQPVHLSPPTCRGPCLDGAFLHFSTFAQGEGFCTQEKSPLNFPTSCPQAFQRVVEKFPSQLCQGWEASRGGCRSRAPLRGFIGPAPPAPGSPAGPKRGLGRAPFPPVPPPSTAASRPSRCCSRGDGPCPAGACGVARWPPHAVEVCAPTEKPRPFPLPQFPHLQTGLGAAQNP